MTNQMPTSQAEDVFRLVNALYQEHGDTLTEAEAAAVRGLRDRMTDILCPYPVAVLEEDRKKLDAKFPDREHWYVRCGKTVTWCDRRKLSPRSFALRAKASLRSAGLGPRRELPPRWDGNRRGARFRSLRTYLAQLVWRTWKDSARCPSGSPAWTAARPRTRRRRSSRSFMWAVWLSCARSAAILRANVAVTST